MNTRKSVRNLSTPELANVRSAYSRMMTIKDDRGYSYNAGIHGIPQFKCKHGESSTESDKNFRLFLPWHREYLYWFEKYLQDAQKDPTVTVPYWDYQSPVTKSEGIPKAFTDAKVSGNPNPLYSFHVVLPDSINLDLFIDRTQCSKSREYDTHRETLPPTSPLLPTPKQIQDVLEKHDYGDFSDGLEEIHNGIHGWVGGRCGDMSNVALAAFDPIFWSHHCMIDRLFWLWQLRPGHSLPLYLHDEVLDPFNRTVKQVLNIYDLGYSYASQQVLVEM
jgi:tyrosinase